MNTLTKRALMDGLLLALSPMAPGVLGVAGGRTVFNCFFLPRNLKFRISLLEGGRYIFIFSTVFFLPTCC